MISTMEEMDKLIRSIRYKKRQRDSACIRIGNLIINDISNLKDPIICLPYSVEELVERHQKYSKELRVLKANKKRLITHGKLR